MNKEMMKQLREDQYDLGLSTTWNFGNFAMFHLLNIRKTIAVSTHSLRALIDSTFGLPVPSNIPDWPFFKFKLFYLVKF